MCAYRFLVILKLQSSWEKQGITNNIYFHQVTLKQKQICSHLPFQYIKQAPAVMHSSKIKNSIKKIKMYGCVPNDDLIDKKKKPKAFKYLAMFVGF